MSIIIRQFLPYFDERPQQPPEIKALVLHCSAYSAPDMIKVLEERELSSHYIIDTEGKIYQLVPEKKRAWHAGQSWWRGMHMLNQYSVGIELSSPDMGQSDYAAKQIRTLLKLSRQIIRHYQIPATNVVAHSDIAPTRKPDPGKSFPWQYLATKGVGLWYDLSDAAKVEENDVAKLLRCIGYDTNNLAAASYAFCRHFAPQAVSEIADIKSLEENVFPPDFVLPDEYLSILKACAYRYGLKRGG